MKTFWRYYLAVLAMVVFGTAVVANFALPVLLGWLLADRQSTSVVVIVGVVAALIGWPCGVMLARQLPHIWDQLTWQI